MSQANSTVVAAPLVVVNLSMPRHSTSTSFSESDSPSGAATPWTYATTLNATIPGTGTATPRTYVKALPGLPPVLQPLRKHETVGHRAPPRRRATSVPLGLGWLAILPGMLVALLSAGGATTLFLYLATRRDGATPPLSRGFYVNEVRGEGAPLLGLLAVTIITNIVWLVGFPILASLTAYIVAAAWLSSQQRPHSLRPNLLTPLQYGLLFQLFSAPGPTSVYHAASYLANRRGRIAAPTFFGRAVLLAGGILGLSILISLADLWLHAAASVVDFPRASAPPEDTPAESGTPLISAHQLRGHYPLAPAFTYLVLLYLHALFALVLTITAACLRSVPLCAPVLPSPSTPATTLTPTPFASAGADLEAGDADAGALATAAYPAPPHGPTLLALAHAQLTDALAPVAARLSNRHGCHAALGERRFVEDVNTARVEVGVWTRDAQEDVGGGKGGRTGGRVSDKARVFGVWKRVVPWRGEIY